jgi:hypothetical protein
MLPKLSEYVSSFSRQTRRTVNDVLAESRLEKAEIGKLVAKISSFSSAADYIPSYVSALSPLQREPIIDLFRDMDLRIQTNYDISQSLSLLRSSMSAIFAGEIEKLERDVVYLESFMRNWTFLSGEEDLYNSSFIENFDNDQNSHIYENSNYKIPDRTGSYFSVKEYATVDSLTDTLKFSNSYERSLVNIPAEDIKEIKYHTNFSKDYISSDTGIINILNNVSSNTWNLTVKSPLVIKESLFEREEFVRYQNGINLAASAQVAIEIVFNKQIKATRIRLTPNSSSGLFVTQIVVESGSGQSEVQTTQYLGKNTVLSSPIYVDKGTDVELPSIGYIKSMIIFLSQKEYVRTKISPLQSESNFKMINQLASAIRVERKNSHDKLQDMVIKYFIKDNARDYIIRNKNLYNYDYTNYYPTDLSKKSVGVLKELKTNKYYSDIDSFNKFRNTSMLSNIVFSIISHSIGSKLKALTSGTYIESNLRQATKSVSSYRSGGLVPLNDSNNIENNLHFLEEKPSAFNQSEAVNLLGNVEELGLYEYMFSLKGISLFAVDESQFAQLNVVPGNRSAFVSKKMPIGGLPLRVKMLSEYFGEISRAENSPAFDSTSIEFSVSVKDNPTLEEDWKPIIPFNDNSIRTELLVLNTFGGATLRFIPNQESVVLYESQVRRDYSTYSINGKEIKVSNYNPNNVYFVSYVPQNINVLKEIELFSRSMSNPVLITSSSNGFNGERFELTQVDNSVRLSNSPYIDRTKFVNATYSSTNGTITTSKSSSGNFDYSSYSPVKILFEDGTFATNLTNYLLEDYQPENFFNTSSVLFVHTGKSIIFNQKITKPFRVLYQYVADVFRYRIIMRNLTKNLDNYSVDRLLFKFSLDKDNVIVDNFTRYDNKYKNIVA